MSYGAPTPLGIRKPNPDEPAEIARLLGENADDTDAAVQAVRDTYLPKAGGTMTGDLVLAGDPDAALKAATKQYVDNAAPAQTMELIAEASGTGASGTITFASIPATFAQLVVVWVAAVTGAASFRMRFNNVSTTSYAFILIGGSTSASQDAISHSPSLNASVFGSGVIDIPGYLSALRKSVSFRTTTFQTAAAAMQLQHGGGMFDSTDPISRIDFILSANNFTSDTRIALYGIKGS